MAVTQVKAESSQEINIGIENKQREAVVKALKQALADSYTLQLKTQYYHWNVKGSNFQTLHLLFGSQYDQLSAGVDELAERIRTLGAETIGTFRQFQELASIKEDAKLPANWQDMVHHLQQDNEALARELREKIAVAQKAGDEGTADLFIRRLQEHEKAGWFLRSHLA